MNRPVRLTLLVTFLSCTTLASSQQQPATSVIVPRLIRFGGVLKDSAGKPLSGVAGVTFGLYKEQEGGAALWLETQNVSLDSSGHYSVLLGATKDEGVPMDLFTSGQAQWLGVHVQGEREQRRVLMVSVPYAIKAADAETLGGLPSSAFALAAPAASSSKNTPTTPSSSSLILATQLPCSNTSGAVNTVTTDGTAGANNVAKFKLSTSGTAPCNIEPSQITDDGSNIGIGIAPTTKLDVNGGALVRGSLSLPANGISTPTTNGGKPSNPLTITASSFKSGTGGGSMNQNFQLQAEPTGNNTATNSATLNLLFGGNGAPVGQTGISLSPGGRVTAKSFAGDGSGLTNLNVGSVFPSGFSMLGSSFVPLTGFSEAGWVALSGQQPWNARSASSVPRYGAVSAVVGGTVYVIGGFDVNAAGLTAVEAYTPDTWTSVASMPTGRGFAAAAVVGGKIYVMGGTSSGSVVNALTTVEAYDPGSNTWTTEATMPTAIWGGTGAGVNGKAYVLGGFVGQSFNTSAKVFQYDPTQNTWAVKSSSMPTPRAWCASANVGNHVFVLGGTNTGATAILNTNEMYDALSDTWTSKAPMPYAAYQHTSQAVNSGIYTMGGFDVIGNPTTTVGVYSSASDVWALTVPLKIFRISPTSATLDSSTFYVIGGNSSGGITGSIEQFDPSTIRYVLQKK